MSAKPVQICLILRKEFLTTKVRVQAKRVISTSWLSGSNRRLSSVFLDKSNLLAWFTESAKTCNWNYYRVETMTSKYQIKLQKLSMYYFTRSAHPHSIRKHLHIANSLKHQIEYSVREFYNFLTCMNTLLTYLFWLIWKDKLLSKDRPPLHCRQEKK